MFVDKAGVVSATDKTIKDDINVIVSSTLSSVVLEERLDVKPTADAPHGQVIPVRSRFQAFLQVTDGFENLHPVLIHVTIF